MIYKCRTSTNSKILWDGVSIISPTSLTAKRNKQLNWEHNRVSFPSQHNNRKDTSNFFCKELQCFLLDDGFHIHNKGASCHEITKPWTHEKTKILREIHLFSNCHHEAFIFVLPSVKPLLSMIYLRIDIHGCESKHMFSNNENSWAIICINNSNTYTNSPQALRGARLFHATHVIHILSLFLHINIKEDAKQNAKPYLSIATMKSSIISWMP